MRPKIQKIGIFEPCEPYPKGFLLLGFTLFLLSSFS